jgi:hypothetical protein
MSHRIQTIALIVILAACAVSLVILLIHFRSTVG